MLELHSVHISYDNLRQNLPINSLIESYIKNDESGKSFLESTQIEGLKNSINELTQIGFFDFEELHFEVYEGKGGHLSGEVVLIDYAKKIAIRGLCRKMAKNIEKLNYI